MRVKDLVTNDVEGDTEYFLEVKGKQTKQKKGQGKKKEREAYIPPEVASDINMVIRMNKLSNLTYQNRAGPTWLEI
ncbi:MAG: hypothetical protein ACLFVB_10240 [Thermoplasmata archaeon]